MEEKSREEARGKFKLTEVQRIRIALFQTMFQKVEIGKLDQKIIADLVEYSKQAAASILS